MASLAMIESPSSTTVVETAPPAYTDEPDAPLEKKADIESVEVVVINHKPITASVVGTIKHLHRVGGFAARWRGLFQAIIYHIAQNVVGNILTIPLTGLLGKMIGTSLAFLLATVGLCRLRMLWTHAMIAVPTSTRWYKRFVPRKQCRPLLLASLNYALAQQATLVFPILVAILLPVSFQGMQNQIVTVLYLLCIPLTFLLTIIFVYLPAAAALTRIEACLLPEDQATIVPFDRLAIVGDIDLTERCSSKKLWRASWKSFTAAARIRVIKLYVKLIAFEIAFVLIAFHVAGAIFYFSNKDQIRNVVGEMMNSN